MKSRFMVKNVHLETRIKTQSQDICKNVSAKSFNRVLVVGCSYSEISTPSPESYLELSVETKPKLSSSLAHDEENEARQTWSSTLAMQQSRFM